MSQVTRCNDYILLCMPSTYPPPISLQSISFLFLLRSKIQITQGNDPYIQDRYRIPCQIYSNNLEITPSFHHVHFTTFSLSFSLPFLIEREFSHKPITTSQTKQVSKKKKKCPNPKKKQLLPSRQSRLLRRFSWISTST